MLCLSFWACWLVLERQRCVQATIDALIVHFHSFAPNHQCSPDMLYMFIAGKHRFNHFLFGRFSAIPNAKGKMRMWCNSTWLKLHWSTLLFVFLVCREVSRWISRKRATEAGVAFRTMNNPRKKVLKNSEGFREKIVSNTVSCTPSFVANCHVVGTAHELNWESAIPGSFSALQLELWISSD